MNSETRLAEIVTALEGVSLTCLIMGGHAVRYYGLSRNTIDFDLHLAPDDWEVLPARLAATLLFAGKPVVEGPSWRPHSFRRFPIGRLPDGRLVVRSMSYAHPLRARWCRLDKVVSL